MKSVVITSKDSPISIADFPAPIPGSGEVLISMQASALNHRDIWIGKGMYAKIQYPVIPGSDGSGIVIASQSKHAPVGTRVIINPNINWGENPEIQSSDYSILGMPPHTELYLQKA